MKFIALSLMAYGILFRALIESVTTSIILRNVGGFCDNHNYQVCLAQIGFNIGRVREFNNRRSISPLQVL
jgi:hypothetical protein